MQKLIDNKYLLKNKYKLIELGKAGSFGAIAVCQHLVKEYKVAAKFVIFFLTNLKCLELCLWWWK